MRSVYLLLAILGAVVPYVFFLAHFQAEGIGLAGFIQAAVSSSVASGLTADLLISSAVFWIWLFHSGARRPWVFILLNLAIGLSCALPAYLYARGGAPGQDAST